MDTIAIAQKIQDVIDAAALLTYEFSMCQDTDVAARLDDRIDGLAITLASVIEQRLDHPYEHLHLRPGRPVTGTRLAEIAHLEQITALPTATELPVRVTVDVEAIEHLELLDDASYDVVEQTIRTFAGARLEAHLGERGYEIDVTPAISTIAEDLGVAR